MNERIIGILEDLVAASFDKEIAEMRGDWAVREEANERINSSVIKASESGVPTRIIGDTQYLGRRNAAMEEGNTDLLRQYEEVLDNSQNESF